MDWARDPGHELHREGTHPTLREPLDDVEFVQGFQKRDERGTFRHQVHFVDIISRGDGLWGLHLQDDVGTAEHLRSLGREPRIGVFVLAVREA